MHAQYTVGKVPLARVWPYRSTGSVEHEGALSCNLMMHEMTSVNRIDVCPCVQFGRYVYLPTAWTVNEPHLPVIWWYKQSLNVQDVFRPIPGFISYARVTGEMGTAITQVVVYS